MNSSQPAVQRSPQLPREEYIEQAHLYKLLRERTGEQVPIQELLEQIHLELLATTKLPMAIDYLLCEVKHSGLMAPAMLRMPHYFSAFQTYLIQQSEEETGRFMTATAFEVLEADAKYRLEGATASGMFFFQFEVLCRNRLNYDKGLWAMSNDPLYDEPMVQVDSVSPRPGGTGRVGGPVVPGERDYRNRLVAAGESLAGKGPFLFGEKEGRIAFANRRKDPLYLVFGHAAASWVILRCRDLKPPDRNRGFDSAIAAAIGRLETRIKLMDQEQARVWTSPGFTRGIRTSHDFQLPELPD